MKPGTDKRYFVNNINVSQSHISQQYQMKFDQSISQSRNLQTSNTIQRRSQSQSQQQIPQAQPPQQSSFKPQYQPQNNQNQQNLRLQSPKLLPQTIYLSIKDKYYEIKKLSTDDPDILFEFYMYYRNTGVATREKTIRELERNVNELRRVSLKPDEGKIKKMERKLEFENSLLYDPNDVYYTLHHEKKKSDLDKQAEEQMRKIEEEYSRRNQSTQKRLSEKVKQRLYPKRTNTKLTDKQKTELQQLKFAHKLLNIYEQHQQYETKDLTVDNLYDLWLHQPNKQQLNLDINKSLVKDNIRKWMHHNIQNLATAHFEKKGIKSDDATILYNFLLQMNSQSINYYEVFIPRKGYSAFYEEYALTKAKMLDDIYDKEKREKSRMARKQKEIEEKVLKRPVSSTPLSILSMPKNGNIEEILELIKKYPHDKNLKRILAEKSIPVIRRPEEYGCHSLEEEIKIKNRVKNESNRNTDKVIENIILNNTVKLEMQEYTSSLMNILNEEKLAESDKWNKTSPLLKQALLAELYSEPYLSSALHQFCQYYLKDLEQVKKIENKPLITHIITHLDKYSKNRQTKLDHLKTLLYKYKQQKQQKQTQEQKNKKNTQRAQKRKFQTFLIEWARVYIQSFIQNKSSNESRRDFLNQFYAKTIQLHKNHVNKHFPVFQQTQGVKSIYSPLLKYQFFKIVKDINPVTMQLDSKAKNAAWTPAGKSDGFKTFNRLATAYYQEPPTQVYKGHSVSDKDQSKMKAVPNVWQKDKVDERSKFMMKMEDAVECMFKPKMFQK